MNNLEGHLDCPRRLARLGRHFNQFLLAPAHGTAISPRHLRALNERLSLTAGEGRHPNVLSEITASAITATWAAVVGRIMTDNEAKKVEQLLDTPNLAVALESDRFKQFLDHIPFAVAVSELHPSERLIYANIEFERLTGTVAAEIHGKRWSSLLRSVTAKDDGRALSEVMTDDGEYIGEFTIQRGDATVSVDAWSNAIQDDNGIERFRLLALADISHRIHRDRESLEQRVREKDTLLRELQHRVKNNLQMVTALVRLEARNLPENTGGERFDRLAGRVDALALLYRLLSPEAPGDILSQPGGIGGHEGPCSRGGPA